MLLKPQLLWDVTTVSVSKYSSYQASGQAVLDCLTLVMKALWSFRMLTIIDKSAVYNITEDVDLWNLHHNQLCFLSSHFSQNIEGILQINRLLTILSKYAGQEGLCYSAHTHTHTHTHTHSFRIVEYWYFFLPVEKVRTATKGLWSFSFPCPWRSCVAKQICMCSL